MKNQFFYFISVYMIDIAISHKRFILLYTLTQAGNCGWNQLSS